MLHAIDSAVGVPDSDIALLPHGFSYAAVRRGDQQARIDLGRSVGGGQVRTAFDGNQVTEIVNAFQRDIYAVHGRLALLLGPEETGGRNNAAGIFIKTGYRYGRRADQHRGAHHNSVNLRFHNQYLNWMKPMTVLALG